MILKDGVTESDEEVIEGLRNIVRAQIGGFAVPEVILVMAYIEKRREFVCFSLSADSARSAKDSLWEDNASYSEEDSS